jgi:hypothetical protein
MSIRPLVKPARTEVQVPQATIAMAMAAKGTNDSLMDDLTPVAVT